MLTTSKSFALLLICVASLIAPAAPADGPPRNKARRIESSTEYARTAIDAYGAGYAFVERATRFDQDAAAASDERSKREAREGAAQAYEDALHAFEEAVRLDERMYEAHTYIGYANRKLARYDQALNAYATALRLKPDYTRAIEYQGETYLGLNRFADAKLNYLRLYALDATQAEKLLASMRRWAEERSRDPREVSPRELAAVSEWLATQPQTDISQIAGDDTPW